MNPTICNLIVSDWAPHIEKTVRFIAVPIAAVYVAGYMAGQWLAQLADAFTEITTARPQAPAVEPVHIAHWRLNHERNIPAASESEHRWRIQEFSFLKGPQKIQRCAVAPVVARCGIQAPDPMARAIAAVRDGSTQAAAARRYGVSRSTLRRRLIK
jgi:hypothetical protein